MKIDELSSLLDDVLDDLSARFIINLPESELLSITRVCFGLEQAHWFYEDFYRPQYPDLPSVNLRAFTAALFSHCPLLWKFGGESESAYDNFLKYKVRVPIRGAILLNKELDRCVLVKGWNKGSGWSFPRGKIDQQEDDVECAIREVKEECGFDIRSYIQPEHFLDVVITDSKMRLYIVPNIPIETAFSPQTRKEISKIEWFKLEDLPAYRKDSGKGGAKPLSKNKFFMVAPFMGPLKKWIKRNRPKHDGEAQPQPVSAATRAEPSTDTAPDTSVRARAAADDRDASEALMLLLGVDKSKPAPPVEAQPVEPKVDLLALLRNGSSTLASSPAQRPSTPLDAFAAANASAPSSAASGNLIQSIFSSSPSTRPHPAIQDLRHDSPRPWYATVGGQPAPLQAQPQPPPDLQALHRRLSDDLAGQHEQRGPSAPKNNAASLLAILQNPAQQRTVSAPQPMGAARAGSPHAESQPNAAISAQQQSLLGLFGAQSNRPSVHPQAQAQSQPQSQPYSQSHAQRFPQPQPHVPPQSQQQQSLLGLFGVQQGRADAAPRPPQPMQGPPMTRETSRQESLLALLNNGVNAGAPNLPRSDAGVGHVNQSPMQQQQQLLTPGYSQHQPGDPSATEQKRRNDDFLLGYLNDAVRRM